MNSKKCETIDCKTNSRLYNYEGVTVSHFCGILLCFVIFILTIYMLDYKSQ